MQSQCKNQHPKLQKYWISLYFAVLPDCYNETYINTYCGKNDCQKNFAEARKDFNSTSCPITPIQSEGVEDSLLYTLMGIYAGIGLLGALVVGLFVDPLTIR